MHTATLNSILTATMMVSAIVVLTVTIVSSVPTLAHDDHHSSVTGFYGLDDAGLPIVDRHGIMLVFDGAIAPATVSESTFDVVLNDGKLGEVVDVNVDGAYVFLKLRHELASDATPTIQIAAGYEVEDLAGNSTNRRKLGAVIIKDGIAPRLTVTLSGGSGTGIGDDGPDRLTKDSIVVRISSDEPLQVAPRVIVVCENLTWTNADAPDDEQDIDDFIANRIGPFATKPQEPPGTSYSCGQDRDGDGNDDIFELTEHIAFARPGDVWEVTWENIPGPTTQLEDGKLVVVAYGRDRSRYERYGETVSNWSVGVGGFGLDTEFEDGLPRGVYIHPPDGAMVDEERPFVIVEFSETKPVELESVLFDGIGISEQFEPIDTNRFVYWPLSMHQGKHEVEVVASDAAGNRVSFEWEFTTRRRGAFVLELQSGWNAISIPSDPLEPSIDMVFTDPSIQAVIGWDAASDADSPWRVAVRRDGEWVSNPQFKALNHVQAGVGYWVKSSAVAYQSVHLYPISIRAPVRVGDAAPTGDNGIMARTWNFVGVVESGGDQTQNHFGETLKDQSGNALTARDYLGSTFDQAHLWDAVDQRYVPLLPSDTLIIGSGIWVHH